ncbi:uncharacterized protein LOC135844407 [Planococcus citri]|uniref:uncharacterized protein LOC135844407 n=1 Tax=Planococcus citri TaxID=170843 RepID=UPI0031F7F88D
MNTLEQRIYVQMTKSTAKSFENFVDSLVKHDEVVSDAELINTMQRITKKLQTVMSKWDRKLERVTHTETNNSCSSFKVPVLTNTGNGGIDDIVNFSKVSRCSVGSTTEIDPKPGCSYNTSSTDYDQEKKLMMVFKDTDEQLYLGAAGFYVEGITEGFWKCNPCDANNLPLNNLLSHVNGKAHKKKINFKGV